MKSIMYHYIRGAVPSLPYFRYLDVEDFQKQLNYFSENDGIISKAKFLDALATGEPKNGVVLTFDDGFTDHLNYVLPVLRKRGWWGLFFIPTAPILTRKLLDVHRIHLLLGRFGGSHCVELLEGIVTDGMLIDEHIESFRDPTYVLLDDDAATLAFKRTLNYYISYDYRDEIIDRLMDEFLDGTAEADICSDYYLDTDGIKALHAAGMTIGSHTVSHRVMSKLPVDQQEREIQESIEFLSDIIDERVDTFCYPYGGWQTFTPETEKLLVKHGVRCAFNVESKDIDREYLLNRPQAVPRYDCNEFPHGTAS